MAHILEVPDQPWLIATDAAPASVLPTPVVGLSSGWPRDFTFHFCVCPEAAVTVSPAYPFAVAARTNSPPADGTDTAALVELPELVLHEPNGAPAVLAPRTDTALRMSGVPLPPVVEMV